MSSSGGLKPPIVRTHGSSFIRPTQTRPARQPLGKTQVAFLRSTLAGQLTGGTGSITLTGVTVGSTNLGNLTLVTPTGNITQFSSTSGQPTINQIQANGFPAGQLQSVSVGNNGLISGTFSNGKNVNLAQIPLVHFNAEDQLQSLTGGAYQATTNSGQAIAGASGQIVGQSLESSNVDIATEFTKLIVTQQAYSANTKVITTANQMSQDLLNVIR